MSVLTSENRSTAALYNWLYGVKQQIGRAHELWLDAGNNTIAIKSVGKAHSHVRLSCYEEPLLFKTDALSC